MMVNSRWIPVKILLILVQVNIQSSIVTFSFNCPHTCHIIYKHILFSTHTYYTYCMNMLCSNLSHPSEVIFSWLWHRSGFRSLEVKKSPLPPDLSSNWTGRAGKPFTYPVHNTLICLNYTFCGFTKCCSGAQQFYEITPEKVTLL